MPGAVVAVSPLFPAKLHPSPLRASRGTRTTVSVGLACEIVSVLGHGAREMRPYQGNAQKSPTAHGDLPPWRFSSAGRDFRWFGDAKHRGGGLPCPGCCSQSQAGAVPRRCIHSWATTCLSAYLPICSWRTLPQGKLIDGYLNNRHGLSIHVQCCTTLRCSEGPVLLRSKGRRPCPVRYPFR